MAAFSEKPLRASGNLLCDKIARHDYLEWESLAHEICERLECRPETARVLDLGCGNPTLLEALSVRSATRDYVAVAHEEAALECARSKAHGVRARIHFVVAETLDFLWGASAHFDVIVAGYALNRLNAEEKEAFLHLAATRLSPRGTLLVHDVFRQPNESRQACLSGYWRFIDENWVGLEPREIQALRRRMGEYPHPEELRRFQRLAPKTGFHVDAEAVWVGRNPYHALLCLTRDHDLAPRAQTSVDAPDL